RFKHPMRLVISAAFGPPSGSYSTVDKVLSLIFKVPGSCFCYLRPSFDSQYTPRKTSSQSILYTFLKYFICH
ncbi:TPA: hypothetical protein ACGHF2_005015, partial [Escherichia coli]